MTRTAELHMPAGDIEADEIGRDDLRDELKDTLVEVIRRQSGKACFASDKFYGCPDVECQWRDNCKQLNEIWLL